MNRALLIGTEPAASLGWTYVEQAPYDGIVIGSLTLGQLLHFRDERVLIALAARKTVLLYTPGLPQISHNRALAAAAASAQRELKNWGVIFTDGGRRRLVTAEEARELKRRGQALSPGAVLTPLAKEIMEGMD